MLIGVGAVACVLLAILGEGIFLGLTDPAKDSVFRRSKFARRRGQHRGLLKSGGFCIVCAGVPVLFAIAAATSGDPADANDAQVFWLVAALLVAMGLILLALWWRLAGRPRHY
jgi:phosphotransferase system  glucose/maltose/N-acetylglucosamine-specific IIC component